MRLRSFGEDRQGLLDKMLFFLRTRHIFKIVKKSNFFQIILDVGCGYNAAFLEKLVKIQPFIKKAIGMDISVNSLLNNSTINLIECDINKVFPFENNFFDAMFCTAVIEHIDNYELALKEMRRVLKSNGVLFLTTPAAPFARPVLEFLSLKLNLLDFQEILDHKRYFSFSEINQALIEAGFEKVEIKRLLFGLNILAICHK